MVPITSILGYAVQAAFEQWPAANRLIGTPIRGTSNRYRKNRQPQVYCVPYRFDFL